MLNSINMHSNSSVIAFKFVLCRERVPVRVPPARATPSSPLSRLTPGDHNLIFRGSYAPPALLALAPPDVLTVLILVNPAQTGPQGRQGDYPVEMAAFDPPSAHFCGSDGAELR